MADFSYTVEFLLSSTHGTGRLPNYQMVLVLTKVLTGNLFIAPMFGLHNKSEEYSVWISPSPPCSGASGVFLLFLKSLHFLPGMLKVQKSVDQESS